MVKYIAHGALLVSYISAILANQLPGIGTIYLDQSLEFLASVYVDDDIKISLVVIEKLGKGRVLFSSSVLNQHNVLVATGNSLVLAPR